MRAPALWLDELRMPCLSWCSQCRLTAFARLRAHRSRDLIAWRSVAIEDSRWGLISARDADLRCVAVTNTYPAAELAADAELVVDGLHALTLDALDQLCAD